MRHYSFFVLKPFHLDRHLVRQLELAHRIAPHPSLTIGCSERESKLVLTFES